MTRRQAIVTSIGALYSAALAGSPATGLVPNTTIPDYTGWTFYGLDGTWYETRLNLNRAKEWAWTEIYKFKKTGGWVMVNPDYSGATHHMLFAVMPDGCPAFIIAPRSGFRGAVIPSGPATESDITRIIENARKAGMIPNLHQ
jgi:hypothetical protein